MTNLLIYFMFHYYNLRVVHKLFLSFTNIVITLTSL